MITCLPLHVILQDYALSVQDGKGIMCFHKQHATAAPKITGRKSFRRGIFTHKKNKIAFTLLHCGQEHLVCVYQIKSVGLWLLLRVCNHINLPYGLQSIKTHFTGFLSPPLSPIYEKNPPTSEHSHICCPPAL